MSAINQREHNTFIDKYVLNYAGARCGSNVLFSGIIHILQT